MSHPEEAAKPPGVEPAPTAADNGQKSFGSALANIPPELNRKRLLDTEQTAEFFAISVAHLRRLYRTGKVPKPIRIGERKYAWQLGGLIDFVAAKSQAAA